MLTSYLIGVFRLDNPLQVFKISRTLGSCTNCFEKLSWSYFDKENFKKHKKSRINSALRLAIIKIFSY